MAGELVAYNISLYTALASVAAITTAVQLTMTAGLRSLAVSQTERLRAAVNTAREDNQVSACRRWGIGTMVAALGGFLVNVSSLVAWSDSVRRLEDLPSLTLPFAAVAVVALATLIVGLAIGARLLSQHKTRPIPDPATRRT